MMRITEFYDHETLIGQVSEYTSDVQVCGFRFIQAKGGDVDTYALTGRYDPLGNEYDLWWENGTSKVTSRLVTDEQEPLIMGWW